jgi:hypothetical protein
MWFGYEVKTGLNRLLSNVRMQERSIPGSLSMIRKGNLRQKAPGYTVIKHYKFPTPK